jgi:starch synthase
MTERPIKVLFVTSEVAPFSKTGGLADISAALPAALLRCGCDIRVLTPRYGFINHEKFAIRAEKPPRNFALDIRGRLIPVAVNARNGDHQSPQVLFAECNSLYDRPGIYVDPFTNRDYIDNDYRFIVLCRTAMEICAAGPWVPDIIHCNDWQTGIIPFYVNRARAAAKMKRLRTVLTIHNIAYHGMFGADTVGRIGGAEAFYFPGGPLEFYNHVNFLKCGLEFADALNTVSPTYAREIQSGYEYGYGLDAVLRARETPVRGILNGIDTEIWNPAADALIPANYTADTLHLKRRNTRALCEKVGLPYEETTPVIGIISRIVAQKGAEILVPILSDILHLPAQLVILGSGDPHYEHIYREAERIFPDRLRTRIGYDDELAHLIEAGADLFLMPSKYEPCGLNQMMSMRYGTLPVVRSTGGLADTVVDADVDPVMGTGFRFEDYRAEALLHAVRRAVSVFRDPARWRTLQVNAMRQDFSWNRSAGMYLEMYRETLTAAARP